MQDNREQLNHGTAQWALQVPTYLVRKLYNWRRFLMVKVAKQTFQLPFHSLQVCIVFCKTFTVQNLCRYVTNKQVNIEKSIKNNLQARYLLTRLLLLLLLKLNYYYLVRLASLWIAYFFPHTITSISNAIHLVVFSEVQSASSDTPS